MLNCTDLECILHHHHYYHHLHQLQHHLHHEHAVPADPPADPQDVNLLNVTDGEPSSLSHLDAPISDSVYMICGVLIAMVLVGLIIVLLAVTISKLRKREESNNNSHNQSSRNPGPGGPGRLHGSVVHPQAQDGAKGVVLAPTAAPAQPAVALNGQSQLANGEATPVSPTAAYVAPSEDGPQEKADPVEVFLWSNPTNRSTCGTQLSLYSGDQDTLVHTLPCEEPRECKGFRKNLRGKWKRLVKKKQPGPDVYAIPPELRDQLKQIYVY